MTAPRIALVTGAGSGIGQACATGLLKDGWQVVFTGRRLETLKAAIAAAGEAGARGTAIASNVGDEDSVAALFAEIQARFGRLDLLFNNAGISIAPSTPDELDAVTWRQAVDTNLNGAFFCLSQAFKLMRAQSPQGGRIINNGSISAHAPRPGSIAYTATKHAITGLTKTAALDGRPYDIAVGQIDIGNVASDMTEKMVKGVPQADGSIKPEPRMDMSAVVDTFLGMARLPLSANVLFTTVMATKMPFVGRGSLMNDAASSKPRIGFIGASGLMGHGMARHLLAGGHVLSLTVHRNTERVADLLAAGAVRVDTGAQLAQRSDIVFLCVTGSPQVEAAVMGEAGVLSGARPGQMIVDCSTSEPESTARLREYCAAAEVVFVDAPLSRTPVEAEAGRLNVMVGADADVFQRLEPVLRCFAENVLHVGGPGAGHTIKLLNNFIAQSICTATAEAFAVGQRAGVDLGQLVALVSAGPVNNGLFQAMAKTLTGDLGGLKFELDNARKDVRYYTHLAESLGVPTLVGEAVHQSLALASALGHGRKMVPSLVEAQEQITGARIVGREGA